MSTDHNILDDIFNTPDEQVDLFMDVLGDSPQSKSLVDDVKKITKGDPDSMSAQKDFVYQKSGFVEIRRGWHGEDYVWHIAPAHHQRPWKVSMSRVVYAVAKTMNQVIPQTVRVNIFLPFDEWEIKEITFKAIGLEGCWNVTHRDIEKISLDLFDILNTLV